MWDRGPWIGPTPSTTLPARPAAWTTACAAAPVRPRPVSWSGASRSVCDDRDRCCRRPAARASAPPGAVRRPHRDDRRRRGRVADLAGRDGRRDRGRGGRGRPRTRATARASSSSPTASGSTPWPRCGATPTRSACPGALWALYMLRQWCQLDGDEVTRLWRARRAAGAGRRRGGRCRRLRRRGARSATLADAVLGGVYQGDLAVALERAAAFFRVVAAGRRSLPARAGERPTTPATTPRWPSATSASAEALTAAAGRWRAGTPALSRAPPHTQPRADSPAPRRPQPRPPSTDCRLRPASQRRPGDRARSTDDRPTPEPQRISGPAELLQAIPYLLGFHPRRSLVLVGLAGSQLVVTARLDLDDAADAALVLRTPCRRCARGGSTEIVGALFDDDAGVAARSGRRWSGGRRRRSRTRPTPPAARSATCWSSARGRWRRCPCRDRRLLPARRAPAARPSRRRSPPRPPSPAWSRCPTAARSSSCSTRCPSADRARLAPPLDGGRARVRDRRARRRVGSRLARR